jgi:hypothetical protein
VAIPHIGCCLIKLGNQDLPCSHLCQEHSPMRLRTSITRIFTLCKTIYLFSDSNPFPCPRGNSTVIDTKMGADPGSLIVRTQASDQSALDPSTGIDRYIATMTITDKRRRPCGICPVDDESSTQSLNDVYDSTRRCHCLNCFQIAYGLIIGPCGSSVPSKRRVQGGYGSLCRKGFAALGVYPQNGRLFVRACTFLLFGY